VTMRRTRETLLACWSGTTDPPGRSALGILVNAIRRDAPSVDVHDVPADQLHPEETPSGSWSEPPVRVAVPLALTDGTDVAEALDVARREDPDIRIARPLGPDWTLAEICVQRLVEAAIDGYSRAARFLSAVWGGPVHVGSVGGRDTPLTDAIDIARAYGRRVVVSSYVLTPGQRADMLRHGGADLVTAPLLDGGPPDPRLVSLVLNRFHQALGVGVPTL
jgi:sirohydrochlorin ferrochelatase